MISVDYKKEVAQACKDNLLESITILQEEMKMLQESAASGTEDGMSDHLESNDEGMMNERKDRENRLAVLYDDLRFLGELDLNVPMDRVGPGSVVLTDARNFFVAIARTFQVGDKAFVGLSTSAPIYGVMEGKRTGENFSFNSLHTLINDVI